MKHSLLLNEQEWALGRKLTATPGLASQGAIRADAIASCVADGDREAAGTASLATQSLNSPPQDFRKSVNILVAVETGKTRPDESRFTRSSSSIWAPAGRP